ncbi:carboxylesterase/lipase family protein [Parahaliea maris]|uniref:carboxylesterase/lipase family protein n=1 Tax=Parahaliea maris TaxID=2716870 RepID=UPI00164F2149|nr:carboxylesterase family protein [Parahaliea maris]
MKPLWKGLAVMPLSVMLGLQACDANREASPVRSDQPVAVDSQAPSFIKVATAEGPVRGVEASGVIAYKGIPYARPPVGELRWRAPQPLSPRDAVLVADEYGNRCMQRPVQPGGFQPEEAFTQAESEDCLYLNVYRPAGAEADLPVMVWIHGGGLVSGSGSRPVNYGGNLAAKGAVIVAMNYRLGRLGFFAHPELSEANPDGGRLFNYGLMDQLAALEWVKTNIAAFGGDPDRVTIFGESAGGASVYSLVSSPAARGLFSGAIAQSGYGRGRQPRVASLAQDGDVIVEEVGPAIAERLGMEDASLEALRALPAGEVVRGTDFSGFISFAVDGAVVTEDLWQSFSSGSAASVPMIVGATDAEFTMGPPEAIRGALEGSSSTTPEIIESLTSFYGDEATRDTFMYSDYVFHAVNRALSVAHEDHGNAVYTYRFAMPGSMSKPHDINGYKVYGAFHAGDMPYTFGNFTGDHMEPKEPGARQRQVSDELQQYWVNFARSGNPNGELLPDWPQAKGGVTMFFTPEATSAQEDLWNERLDALNKALAD